MGQKRVMRTDIGMNALVRAFLDSKDTELDASRKLVLIGMMYERAREGDLKAIQLLMERYEGPSSLIKPYTDEEYQANFRDTGYMVYKILHTLFDAQLHVINAGNGQIICKCSRRAGKSMCAAAIMLIECLKAPRTNCIYIGETMKLGEQIIGSAMSQIIDVCNLKGKDGKRLNWRHLDNESQIIIRGLSNTRDPDTIRGLKAKVVIIDEFFHLQSDLLAYLQHEVLEPMQLDYAGEYKEIFLGTPPRVKGTYGGELWNDAVEHPEKDIKTFHWTAKDNPFIKDFDAYVEQKCKEMALPVTAPYIQREYFGNDVYDEDCLVFPEYHTYDPTDPQQLPQIKPTDILIGLDYGDLDNDALIATAWDKESQRGYVFYETKFNRLTVPKGVAMIEYLRDKCREVWQMSLDMMMPIYGHDITMANKHILWEADTSDNQISEDLMYTVKLDTSALRSASQLASAVGVNQGTLAAYDKLHINIAKAYKYDSEIIYDKLNILLRRAALLIPKGGPTEKEFIMAVYVKDAAGRVTKELDDKFFHPDLIPALRYSFARMVDQI